MLMLLLPFAIWFLPLNTSRATVATPVGEHDSLSHQNPPFVGAVPNLRPDTVRVYLLPDANHFPSATTH